jgi:hypothetical protein
MGRLCKLDKVPVLSKTSIANKQQKICKIQDYPFLHVPPAEQPKTQSECQ